jgi:nicotinamide-nucleotide amidase
MGSNASMTPSDRELEGLAADLGRVLEARGWRMVAAESCTGGWIAKAITDVAGSSAWFDSGFVTYANEAKKRDLAVPDALLAEHGAVSEPVVRAMAEGGRARTGAEVAVAVSGVAGPGGGSEGKPVGTVWFAWSVAGAGTRSERCRYPGDRETVRRCSVAHALREALALVGSESEEGG